MNNFSIK